MYRLLELFTTLIFANQPQPQPLQTSPYQGRLKTFPTDKGDQGWFKALFKTFSPDKGGPRGVGFKSYLALAVCILLALSPTSTPAADVKALLKKADSYRLESESMQVETEVKLIKQGKLDKERRYTVYLKPGRRSLVLMQSPGEKGQKVLMLGDEFWQIMPQSRRPFRITPMQKLLGDAAVGDIATMNWGDDYEGTITGSVVVDEIACLHLSLSAKSRGVSYQRIELYLVKADSRPIRADLYVASDKMAKQARFTVEPVNGRPQVSAMIIRDQIQLGRETVIRYLSRKAGSISEEYFNPMFLTRNDLKP